MKGDRYILTRDCAYNAEYNTVYENDKQHNQANKGGIVRVKSKLNQRLPSTFKDKNFFTRPLYDRIVNVFGRTVEYPKPST